jgi:hypothetical protein
LYLRGWQSNTWATPLFFFALVIFRTKSCIFCLGRPQTIILQISASLLAGITDVHHGGPPLLFWVRRTAGWARSSRVHQCLWWLKLCKLFKADAVGSEPSAAGAMASVAVVLAAGVKCSSEC